MERQSDNGSHSGCAQLHKRHFTRLPWHVPMTEESIHMVWFVSSFFLFLSQSCCLLSRGSVPNSKHRRIIFKNPESWFQDPGIGSGSSDPGICPDYSRTFYSSTYAKVWEISDFFTLFSIFSTFYYVFACMHVLEDLCQKSSKFSINTGIYE